MATIDPYLKAYVQPNPESHLRNEIGQVWESINGPGGRLHEKLYSGQPRSSQSEQAMIRAQMAVRVAMQSNDRRVQAEACRLMAHTLNVAESYESSIEFYKKAVELFEAADAGEQAARTRLGFMGALFMIGRYDEALVVAEAATVWFQQNNHIQGLAKVAANLGNLHYRRWQHGAALKHHSIARELFDRLGDWHGLAMTYLNLGNCYAYSEDLDKAEQVYRASEELSERLGMHELLMQSRYNRAYLMFLQGRHKDALLSFTIVRDYFQKTGSEGHVYLCDLDVAEIYLHTGRSADTVVLAQRAAAGFEKLGMVYEQAKALTFCSMGLIQVGRADEAEAIGARARRIFHQEGNSFWTTVLDACKTRVRMEELLRMTLNKRR